MCTTLEALEKRVEALEQEVSALRAKETTRRIDESAAERGARLWREAGEGRAAFAAAWIKALEQMGIRGQPIGAENVQAMIAACGFKPEDNEFSRGIIAMRKE